MVNKKKPDTPEPEKPTSILPRFDGLGLNPQMERFVITYCADYTFNATRAYMETYDNEMEPSVAASCASKLLRIAKVREAVRRQMEHQLEDKDILARRIIDEHSKIAFAHSAMIMDSISSFGYVVKDFAEIPDEYKAAIAGFKKTETGLLEVKFYDKQKSLDSLARILGMFDDAAAKVGEKYEDLIARARASKQNERE